MARRAAPARRRCSTHRRRCAQAPLVRRGGDSPLGRWTAVVSVHVGFAPPKAESLVQPVGLRAGGARGEVDAAGAVSVRVVAVELVAVVVVLAVEALLCAWELVEAADVSELVVERELLAVLVAADVVLAVVLAGVVVVAVTAAGVLDPHAASVAASTAAAASVVAVGIALIGRGDGSGSQSVPPAVMVRRDGSESDGP